MPQSCVTISLVEQARGGPFVFWDDLADGCKAASELGFDAIEIFSPGPEAIDAEQLKKLLEDHSLKLAALGTGAGWVIHRKSLTSGDASQRQEAIDFVRSIIDAAGAFGAMAIIGSMQGRAEGDVDHATALGYLGEALQQLGEHASQYKVPLLYEPLNRYETNLVNTVADGVALLDGLETNNVKLLADLFHMNIEEVSIADALRAGGDHIGHIHFVDSNRRAAGFGHMDYTPIIAALREINYEGYLCAEALALPDSLSAAQQTINKYRELCGS
jgi:sugar phosphate isomerase/epimerase